MDLPELPEGTQEMANMTAEQSETALNAVALAGTWIANFLNTRAHHMKWAHPDTGPCPPFCQDNVLIAMLADLAEHPTAMGQVLTVALDYIFTIQRQIELARVVEGRS